MLVAVAALRRGVAPATVPAVSSGGRRRRRRRRNVGGGAAARASVNKGETGW